ncbi:hypothetical protein FHR83_005380 [Actinoplanes campanulatus]|uniref:Uncharacterized protein n=1 Tax=Actinoplanes campanulatus TaxID=113559 RepID=A0A7W5AK12_9ACTN|nr:hypothetical protein [Actinoplanes campanulatus]MBB3097696.1 hypothetical protein [Actinoplanes campanulatus]GGN37834.1 hypothetical protein GCM10010109_64160 [Actinoplanes campanulatus]GID39738.1 hypothetical protein Aca09nite_62440 [Actinoplanes campanulatus]
MTITHTTAATPATPGIDRPHGDNTTGEHSSQLPADGDARYFAALRTLSARAVTAKAAMLKAHLATNHQERTAAFVDLHYLLRGMAGIVNDALGTINERQEPR